MSEPKQIERLLAGAWRRARSGARRFTGALSWIGRVNGDRVGPLGADPFVQTGDAPNLYSLCRIDAEAIVDPAAELFLDQAVFG